MEKMFLSILCALTLAAGVGCSAGGTTQSTAGTPASQTDSSAAPTENPTPTPSETVEPAEATAENDVAVVYFSGTGNTAAIAQTMAQILDAPIYEITPAEPYTSEDLNYSNNDCRANREQKDDAARPVIANDLSMVESCSTIYLGYPIWWGTNPKIIESFLDAYDLSGSIIHIFCTSGGSSVETSVSHLQEQYPNAGIIGGYRFNTGASESDIEDWLGELE